MLVRPFAGLYLWCLASRAIMLCLTVFVPNLTRVLMQVRVAESAKAKQTRVTAPEAIQPVIASVPKKQTHSDAGSSLGWKNADIKTHKQTALQSVDTDGQRTVMSLLSKLKLLQDEGAHFARRLQPSV